MQTCDILIKNARYLDSQFNLQKGSIAIASGSIVSIGKDKLIQATKVIEDDHLLWMPGLVDGHIHTAQQFLRGRLLDERPVIWKRINVPFESMLTPENSRLSAQIAALEMIKNGTTGFVDAGGKYVEEYAEVYQKAGLRGRLSFMSNDNPHFPASLRSTAQDAVQRQIGLAKELNGRIGAIFSVTVLNAVSDELAKAMFEAAKEHHVPMETHMNEYASEVTDFVASHGIRPFLWLEKEGLLRGRFLAAHCIFLSEEEKEILRDHHIRVVHCPFSNCGKGIPDTPSLLSRGISIGLGSDGSGHGGMDMFKEMRLFHALMSVTHGVKSADSACIPARTILKMATQGGANVLFADHLGTIEQGNKADLIALNMDQPHLLPSSNVVHTVLESASGNDVASMIVDGNIVMENRQVLTLDEERIMAEAKKATASFPAKNQW